jgi:hypothetical protein
MHEMQAFQGSGRFFRFLVLMWTKPFEEKLRKFKFIHFADIKFKFKNPATFPVDL